VDRKVLIFFGFPRFHFYCVEISLLVLKQCLSLVHELHMHFIFIIFNFMYHISNVYLAIRHEGLSMVHIILSVIYVRLSVIILTV